MATTSCPEQVRAPRPPRVSPAAPHSGVSIVRAEFNRVVKRIPDFMSRFQIQLQS
jgi:hypothetical protein